MGELSSELLPAFVIGIILIIAIVAAMVMIRRRRPQLEALRKAPFMYNVAPPAPSYATAVRSLQVAGLPATVAILDPYARHPDLRGQGGALMTVQLELPLGPQWPQFTVVPRSGVQELGLFIARTQKVAGTELRTNDEAFDDAFWLGYLDSDPEFVQQVLNPSVRAAILALPLRRMYVVHKFGVVLECPSPQQVDALVARACQLAELLVGSSGIPIYLGPPATM